MSSLGLEIVTFPFYVSEGNVVGDGLPTTLLKIYTVPKQITYT